MKKTKYIILGSLLIAFVLLISGSILGGFEDFKKIYNNNDFNMSVPFVKRINTVKEFSDVNNLEIHSEGGSVEIVEYDGSTIRIETKNISSKIKLEQKHDTLIIKNGFKLLDFGSKAKIKIYLPTNSEFNEIVADVDAGNLIVSKLKAKEIKIDVDAGKFKADLLTTVFTKVDVDAGDVKINLLNCDKSEFECDAGNIVVMMTGNEADYNYEASCDVGTIKIGSYHTKGSSDKYYQQDGLRQIKADCDVGKIVIRMEE